MTCERCGGEAAETFRYCPHCGAESDKTSTSSHSPSSLTKSRSNVTEGVRTESLLTASNDPASLAYPLKQESKSRSRIRLAAVLGTPLIIGLTSLLIWFLHRSPIGERQYQVVKMQKFQTFGQGLPAPIFQIRLQEGILYHSYSMLLSTASQDECPNGLVSLLRMTTSKNELSLVMHNGHATAPQLGGSCQVYFYPFEGYEAEAGRQIKFAGVGQMAADALEKRDLQLFHELAKKAADGGDLVGMEECMLYATLSLGEGNLEDAEGYSKILSGRSLSPDHETAVAKADAQLSGAMLREASTQLKHRNYSGDDRWTTAAADRGDQTAELRYLANRLPTQGSAAGLMRNWYPLDRARVLKFYSDLDRTSGAGLEVKTRHIFLSNRNFFKDFSQSLADSENSQSVESHQSVSGLVIESAVPVFHDAGSSYASVRVVLFNKSDETLSNIRLHYSVYDRTGTIVGNGPVLVSSIPPHTRASDLSGLYERATRVVVTDGSVDGQIIHLEGPALSSDNGSSAESTKSAGSNYFDSEVPLGNAIPSYVQDWLNTPTLAFQAVDLNDDGSPEKFERDANECGSGGCTRTITDGQSHHLLLTYEDHEVIHQLSSKTAGYHDLADDGGNTLEIMQFDGVAYKPTRCFHWQTEDGSSVPRCCREDRRKIVKAACPN